MVASKHSKTGTILKSSGTEKNLDTGWLAGWLAGWLTDWLNGVEFFLTSYCHSASQENSHLLWNPKVHHHVHKSLPLVPCWARCIQSTPSHTLAFQVVSSLQVFSPKFCMHLSSVMHAACPIHLILLDLITLIILKHICLQNTLLQQLHTLPVFLQLFETCLEATTYNLLQH